MQAHALDTGVFIRSMATRGHLGGLSATTSHVIAVLAASGKDVILVETVGVGQDEVDIVGAADISLVVLVPGFGDEVQALKAGIMEIADVFVVNKSDRDGADRVVSEIESMLSLVPSEAPLPPIVQTVASQDQGVAELLERIAEVRQAAEGSGALERGRRKQLRRQFDAALAARLLRGARDAVLDASTLESTLDRLVARELDPLSAADEIAARLGL
jgi:LAO/AO transport system kinase